MVPLPEGLIAESQFGPKNIGGIVRFENQAQDRGASPKLASATRRPATRRRLPLPWADQSQSAATAQIPKVHTTT